MASEKLHSPVTGMVWKIVAEVGQVLEEGADVLILESMKMEIPVSMPRPGRLAALRVKEGDAVAEGQPLADLE